MNAELTGLARVSDSHLIRAFAVAMGAVSTQGIRVDQTPVIDPQMSDEIVAGSGVVRRIREAAPWLTLGPAAEGYGQEWVATARPVWLPARVWRPERSAFQDVRATHGHASPGPHPGGLFTCTAPATRPGMWRTWLDAQGENALWPKPWRVWRVRPTADLNIYQVSDAQAWTALVLRHHHRSNGIVRPDWHSIADAVDAVHLTPAALCAMDGLSLITDAGPTAPTYWTVECTFWLRWCFDTQSTVEEVGYGASSVRGR